MIDRARHLHELDVPVVQSPADLRRVEEIPWLQRQLPSCTHALVQQAARAWPERPAVTVLAEHPERSAPAMEWTFAELAQEVNRMANGLMAAGTQHGGAVSFMSRNCSEMIAGILAAQSIGVAAPMNPALTSGYASQLLAQSE